MEWNGIQSKSLTCAKQEHKRKQIWKFVQQIVLQQFVAFLPFSKSRQIVWTKTQQFVGILQQFVVGDLQEKADSCVVSWKSVTN